MLSEQATTLTSENERARPTRPAPSIPTGLSRGNTRRDAPAPPPRSESTPEQSQAIPRQNVSNLQRQGSFDDNTAYTVRTIIVTFKFCSLMFNVATKTRRDGTKFFT